MKFLNEIDGADKLKQDNLNRLVTDNQVTMWSNKQDKLIAGDNIIITGNTISSTSNGGSSFDDTHLMPKNNGNLESYTEKLVGVSSSNIDLSLGNVFNKIVTADTTFTIENTKPNVSHSFTLYLNIGATLRTVSYPASVKWQDGEVPVLVANKMYILTFSTIDGGTTWFGNWGEY